MLYQPQPITVDAYPLTVEGIANEAAWPDWLRKLVDGKALRFSYDVPDSVGELDDLGEVWPLQVTDLLARFEDGYVCPFPADLFARLMGSVPEVAPVEHPTSDETPAGTAPAEAVTAETAATEEHAAVEQDQADQPPAERDAPVESPPAAEPAPVEQASPETDPGQSDQPQAEPVRPNSSDGRYVAAMCPTAACNTAGACCNPSACASPAQAPGVDVPQAQPSAQAAPSPSVTRDSGQAPHASHDTGSDADEDDDSWPLAPVSVPNG